MTRIYSLLSVILLILSCNQKPETESDIQKRIIAESAIGQKIIDSINKKFEKFYKNKQADSLLSQMTDEGIQFPPNSQPLEGKDSIRKYWQQLFELGDVDFSLRTQKVKANGPLAIERGKYSFKFTPITHSSIPPIIDSGNYVVYWKRVDGKWEVVWDAPVSTIPLR
jgi:ketosteroid isomerase-like protein